MCVGGVKRERREQGGRRVYRTCVLSECEGAGVCVCVTGVRESVCERREQSGLIGCASVSVCARYGCA